MAKDDWFDDALHAAPHTGPHIDTSVPSPARMYDYYLGGKDNFPADREAAKRQMAVNPQASRAVHNNRRFLVRAVRFVAEQGIDQYVDLGAGIPTSPNVHEVARELDPGARIAYVDNDPVVVSHSRALRATEPGVMAIEADARDTDTILARLTGHLDWSRPVAVLALGLLHFMSVPEGHRLLATFRELTISGDRKSVV